VHHQYRASLLEQNENRLYRAWPTRSGRLADENQALVRGAAALLKQQLLNLVDNALTYTPPGGRVELSLAVADGQAPYGMFSPLCGSHRALIKGSYAGDVGLG
jgi:signal transduction histidine kinase